MSASTQTNPTRFNMDEVEGAISATRFAGCFHHLAVTGSTNQVALEAAAKGLAAGAWLADEQTAGRGRGGHTWHSAAGEGLYLSVLVAPQLAMAEAGRLPLATGLAVQAALVESTGLKVDLRWPNDLMLDGKKAGGILAETTSEPGSSELRYAVIGIGINVNHAEFPPDLRDAATSLRIAAGHAFRREPLTAAILCRLDAELSALQAADLLARFESCSSWAHGMQVQVAEAGGYTGVTCGLDPRGFLRVRTHGGEVRTVLSGGVRPLDGAR